MILTRKILSMFFILFLFLSIAPVAHAGNIPVGSACPSGSSLDCEGTSLCVNNICQHASDVTNGTYGFPQTTNPGGVPQVTNPGTPGTSALNNPLNSSTLTDLLNKVLTYVVQLGAIFLTIMLVYVGFLFVSARGNEEGIKKARSALLWTVVGGLLLLGAKALSDVITATVQGL
ncbi:hypothetical protein H0X32_03460 [Patescibacteria group bacterium]|nr:hypothetical protein [Patescibacteria group bacterium]